MDGYGAVESAGLSPWTTPVVARRRCLHRDCDRLIPRGSYCAEHKPYGPGWAATSGAVLRRDGFVCRCGGCSACMFRVVGDDGTCGRRATTVDHINGVAQDNRPENLRAMCRPCNTVKGGL